MSSSTSTREFVFPTWQIEAFKRWFNPPSETGQDGVDSADKSGPRRANVRAHGHRGKDPQ